MVFGDFGVLGSPWGPPWLPDLAPGPSGPLRTLIFGDFRSLLGRFWEDFGWICVTMSCRIVTRVMCENIVPQTLYVCLVACMFVSLHAGTVAGLARRAIG